MGCRLSVLNFTWPWQVDAIFTVWNIMQWGVAIRTAVALFDQSPPATQSCQQSPASSFYWVGDAQHAGELEWHIDGSYGVRACESDTGNLNRWGCLCGAALLSEALQCANGDERTLKRCRLLPDAFLTGTGGFLKNRYTANLIENNSNSIYPIKGTRLCLSE